MTNHFRDLEMLKKNTHTQIHKLIGVPAHAYSYDFSRLISFISLTRLHFFLDFKPYFWVLR